VGLAEQLRPVTVDALIQQVLSTVMKQFYHGRENHFWRDKHALLKCIARYGYACNERGWQIEPGFILAEIGRVLESAAKHKASIEYLPAYLDAALTRAIGQRAEELSEAALHAGKSAPKLVQSGTRVNAVLQPTAVEILSALHGSLKTKRRPQETPKQQMLFSV
jgi:hypothetical protein